MAEATAKRQRDAEAAAEAEAERKRMHKLETTTDLEFLRAEVLKVRREPTAAVQRARRAAARRASFQPFYLLAMHHFVVCWSVRRTRRGAARREGAGRRP